MTDNTETTTLGNFDRRHDAVDAANTHNRAIMLAMLKRMGIARVSIEFDGGGDSGQIVGITCEGITTNPKEHAVEDVLLATVNTSFGARTSWRYDVQLKNLTNSISHHTRRGRPTLYDAIEAWAYEILDGIDHDWVNNDGGYGEIVIQPVPPEGEDEILIDLSIRVTSTENYILTA